VGCDGLIARCSQGCVTRGKSISPYDRCGEVREEEGFRSLLAGNSLEGFRAMTGGLKTCAAKGHWRHFFVVRETPGVYL
jgi:hypothetical protein